MAVAAKAASGQASQPPILATSAAVRCLNIGTSSRRLQFAGARYRRLGRVRRYFLLRGWPGRIVGRARRLWREFLPDGTASAVLVWRFPHERSGANVDARSAHRASAEQAEVRDDERYDEVQATLDPGGRGGVSADDHVELIDRRKHDANNEGNANGASQVATLQAVTECLVRPWVNRARPISVRMPTRPHAGHPRPRSPRAVVGRTRRPPRQRAHRCLRRWPLRGDAGLARRRRGLRDPLRRHRRAAGGACPQHVDGAAPG